MTHQHYTDNLITMHLMLAAFNHARVHGYLDIVNVMIGPHVRDEHVDVKAAIARVKETAGAMMDSVDPLNDKRLARVERGAQLTAVYFEAEQAAEAFLQAVEDLVRVAGVLPDTEKTTISSYYMKVKNIVTYIRDMVLHEHFTCKPRPVPPPPPTHVTG